MKKFIVILFIILGSLVLVVAVPVFMFRTVSLIQELESHGRSNTIKLIQRDSIDRNYEIQINGDKIYSSPDFFPRRDFPYLANICFSDDQEKLVFRVHGHRIWGYDIGHKRELSNEALLSLVIVEPKLYELGYESEWPGIGRARNDAGRKSEQDVSGNAENGAPVKGQSSHLSK